MPAIKPATKPATKPRKPSWLINDYAWKIILPQHSPAAFILRALAKHANDSGKCFLSYARISASCGGCMSSATIARSLRFLRDTPVSILSWKRGHGSKSGTDNKSNSYTLNLAAMKKLIAAQGIYDPADNGLCLFSGEDLQKKLDEMVTFSSSLVKDEKPLPSSLVKDEKPLPSSLVKDEKRFSSSLRAETPVTIFPGEHLTLSTNLIQPSVKDKATLSTPEPSFSHAHAGVGELARDTVTPFVPLPTTGQTPELYTDKDVRLSMEAAEQIAKDTGFIPHGFITDTAGKLYRATAPRRSFQIL